MDELNALLGEFPGTFAENKRFSVAVHYRQAPQWATPCGAGSPNCSRPCPVREFTMLQAHFALEVKTPAFDKGRAIAAFLEEPPFRGLTRSSSATTRPTKRASPHGRGRRRMRIFGRAQAPARRGRVRSPGAVRAWLAPSLTAARPHERAEDAARPQPLDLALIGNSCVAALVDRQARLVWWCFPRFDGDPVFSRLLTGDVEKGFSDVVLDGQIAVESRYLRNTAIVETILAADGGVVRVTDFAPRFDRFERPFRPPQILRRIEPVAGLPRITLRVRPTHNYGRPTQNAVVGSNHVRYVGGPHVMRLRATRR